MTQPVKQFELLLKKAAQDEYVLDSFLADENAPLEIFGFHAQQAAEKIMKAVLALHQLAYPATHRLVELIDLAKANHISVPQVFEEIRYLTPFAVEYRYTIFIEEQVEPLDKIQVRQLLKSLREWAETQAERLL